jgi:hypothetical protein
LDQEKSGNPAIDTDSKLERSKLRLSNEMVLKTRDSQKEKANSNVCQAKAKNVKNVQSCQICFDMKVLRVARAYVVDTLQSG